MISDRPAHVRSRLFHRVPLRVLASLCAVATLAAFCEVWVYTPDDLVVHLDVLDPATNLAAEAAPARPIVLLGPDGVRGTADDFLVPGQRGDIDLVVRAGTTALSAPIATAPPTPIAVPAQNGLGAEIDFAVQAVAGFEPHPLEAVVKSSPSLHGRSVLVLAFPDLDADGRVGPTRRDGIAPDDEVEAAELVPVGMQLVTFSNAGASGRIRLLAAGPAGRPLRVALAAIALLGPTDPGFLGGVVPTGPALMTALPFLPPFDRSRAFDAGPQGPEPATPDRPLGIRMEAEFIPAPSDPTWGDQLDLAVDGSEISIDVVDVISGPATHFGVAKSAFDPDYVQTRSRQARPGLDDLGGSHPYEIAGRIHVADDGGDSRVALQVVALDRLGNVTDPSVPTSVALSTAGNAAILWPDVDGDPFSETVLVATAAGAAIVLDDRAGAYDDRLDDVLVISHPSGGSRVDLVSPDPDVDDSGLVDPQDVGLVVASIGARAGDPSFEDRYDVDGNGRIDRSDELIVRRRSGSLIAIP